ncbi:helix-turn-helix domain-containing protein [Mesorhizobium carmichaelinearum]|uniref:helix-turn-helix domain-containing protein n=1 Tax=Mesorhizobium carmichaelinearum TaxID=1208188 RepID=UPI00117E90A3|nr:helix-turn-helix transcriptional regulator [Mesorhizobium carmichaelinearum]
MAAAEVAASNDQYKLTPFGRLCTEGRTAMTMTRPEMAKLVNTSPRDISLIETGQKTPPAHYVVLVMGILGLDLEEVEAALAAQDPTYKLTRVPQPRYGDVR